MVVAVATLLLLAGCSSGEEVEPFGAADTVCDSIEVRDENADQANVQNAISCLMAEMEAGRAVTVDIKFPAPGGAAIYTRYDFDGERVWVIQDDRLDAFSANTVQSEKCTRLVPTDWLPVGVDCDVVAHPGFPEVNANA